MVDGSSAEVDDVAAITAVVVSDFAGTPVLGGDKSDGRTWKTQALPPVHLIDLFKTKAVDEISHARRNDDGLVGGDFAEAAAMEVIKMGMGDEDEIDGGEVVVEKTSVTEAADHEEPVGPVWIDEDIGLRSLQKKRGVANPGEADLAFFKLWKDGGSTVTMTAFTGEKSREKHVGNETMGWPTNARMGVIAHGLKDGGDWVGKQPSRQGWRGRENRAWSRSWQEQKKRPFARRYEPA